MDSILLFTEYVAQSRCISFISLSFPPINYCHTFWFIKLSMCPALISPPMFCRNCKCSLGLIKRYTFSAISWKSLPNTILTVEYEASCITILGFLFSVMVGFHFLCESLVFWILYLVFHLHFDRAHPPVTF